MRDLFANIFEFWGSLRSPISADLYDFIYLGAGFILLLLTLGMSVLFYFILFPKSAKWDTLFHWIIWLILTILLSVLIIGLYTNGVLNREDLNPVLSEYLEFLVSTLFWSSIFFFVFSLLFKPFGHPSRRRLPF